MTDGLLILGMHRSGTSAVAGQLAALGFYPGGDLLPAQADNPKGFFEPRAVVELHDEILKLFGSSWDDPRPLPECWMQVPALVPYRERLAALVQTEYGAAEKWLVKDPRLCRLLPLWREVLGALGVRPKILLVVRPPAEVIASLGARSRTDPEQAAQLWLAHYAEAEIASRGLVRAVVMYQDWLADWQAEMARVAAELAVAVPGDGDGFAEPGLRHHEHAVLPGLQAPQAAWLQALYEALLAWRQTGVSPGETADAVAEDVAVSAQAALPVLAYLREQDARAHALASVQAHEAEIARLRAAGGLGGENIFTRHFQAEQARATAKAQSLAHERLMLIKQMQASASWRLTRPLRALKRLVRR